LRGFTVSQKLRKIMVENVVTVQPDESVKQAAELMNLHEIGCLVVVNCGKPVGIVTERDMLKRVINSSRIPSKIQVMDIMTKPVVSASPNMRAGDAAKLMLERNIKKLPIVENGKLVGLVSLTDLLRTPGVVQFLNRLSLDGTSARVKRTVELYVIDSATRQKRKCPLMTEQGFQMGCRDQKCMWWMDEECAVTRLARQFASDKSLEMQVEA
jgi:CBS domain-containing protein